ncbi:hypothetical protein BV22DRAFT_1193657 [Leucogyrophana mollusca]|uniref:Uncharacterized protein n=1 Tax=Leucogyrophana mollusca TaxID=85980 RepID=A0ACB8BQ61_9AGAM|nr:hypothetical protein BV22DRAFT_1193657 [Leucogyrophana mollusca]
MVFSSKWYIAFLLACVLQVSVALPIELAERDRPVADNFGGGGGGGGGPDW